jgi:putative transcriptional regulator
VIRFKLAEQIEKKQFRESRRITIQEVAEILNHRGYSTGTDIVDKLCTYFGCSVADLLEHIADEG